MKFDKLTHGLIESQIWSMLSLDSSTDREHIDTRYNIGLGLIKTVKKVLKAKNTKTKAHK